MDGMSQRRFLWCCTGLTVLGANVTIGAFSLLFEYNLGTHVALPFVLATVLSISTTTLLLSGRLM